MTIDTATALAALGGTALQSSRLPANITIGTDTRTTGTGMTFLALRGERFDGHAFVAEAYARGAVAAIVDDATAVPAGCAAIVVGDTLAAYLTLGGLARARIGGPVIAISGSTGKTTTKAFLLQLLAAAAIPVTATPANENNEIGVSKFLLGFVAGDPGVAIVEMGARKFGDLGVLVAAARPTVAVLTNIGDAHLEIMGSLERLAQTKWGLFSGGARAVLNLADTESRARATTLAQAPLWFGLSGESAPPGADSIVLGDHSVCIRDGVAGSERTLPVTVAVPGEHNRRNLAAALAAGVAAGIAADRLAPHLGAVKLPAGRYETIPLAGGRRLIFDAYNASMAGTLATLEAFAGEAGRRIAVLGSMAELGADAASMHRRVGAAAAGTSEFILAGGDFAAEIVRGATDAGTPATRMLTYADNAVAVEWLREHARPGDAILLKGSRKYRMEEIAAALRDGPA